MRFNIIANVINSFDEPAPLDEIRKDISEIRLKDEYLDGLYKIEKYDYLQILYYFDRSETYNLKAPRHNDEIRGVFASRSPNRPSGIGITTVKFLERKDNILKVKGLDAINGTPVLDIKPYSAELVEASFFKEEGEGKDA